MTTLPARMNLGLLLLRIALGVVFVAHGGQKLFVMGPDAVAGFFAAIGIPFPGLNAWIVIGVELAGGLALLAGAATRVAGVLIAFTMLVALATVHLAGGFFAASNGIEFPLTLLLVGLGLVATGPGAYSVDAWRAGRAATSAAPAIRRAA